MTTKTDQAAADRVLKRAVAKAIARLRDCDGNYTEATKQNEWTFIVAGDAAELLTEDAA